MQRSKFRKLAKLLIIMMTHDPNDPMTLMTL